MLNLSQALRISKNMVIAFVGGGGKTTAMFRVATELSPALVTTSTHIREWQAALADHHFIWAADAALPDIESQLGTGITLVTGEHDDVADRFLSLTFGQIEVLKHLARNHNLPLLIEADGSRQKPLKAPAEHEPAIPTCVEMVVVVAGMSGLGKNLNAERIHRPQIYGNLSGLTEGETITTAAIVKVLTHPNGGLKNIPSQARRVVLLNQADTPELQAQAHEIGRFLLNNFDAVIISALNSAPRAAREPVVAIEEKTAAVILAAGSSSRYGQPKQLLDYHGRPFVRVISETALKAGLTPVIVVCGAHATAVRAAIADLPINIVDALDWQEGQSAALKTGVRCLPSATGAAIFLLVDQPQVSVELLRALQERHSQDLPAVLAPYVFDQRANPILFDQVTFADLLTISGDSGGRAIFSKFSPRFLNWYDRQLLLDVDTPEDYDKLMSNSEC